LTKFSNYWSRFRAAKWNNGVFEVERVVYVLFMSGEQKGDKDCPRSQLGIVGRVTLPGDITLTRLEL